MKTLIGFEEIEDKIITLRGQKVLLDRDVAALYGVETRDINEALRNNLDKFPPRIIVLRCMIVKNSICGRKFRPVLLLKILQLNLKLLQRKVFICLLPF